MASVFDLVADILDPPDDNWVPLPHQVPPPGKWFGWMLAGGRGAGKTATAARYVHELVHGPPMIEGVPGGHWISIVGPTLGDAVTSCVLGPSGLRKWDPGIKVVQSVGGTIVRWSNGVEAKVFGAQSPDDVERFRAGGNRTFVWCEELAAWRYMEASFQQIRYGLRSGTWPHMLITTTPKPRNIIKEIHAKAEAARLAGEDNPEYVMTHAPTSANPHLDDRVKAMLYADYEGTRLGRQELQGELLLDIEDALWAPWMIDDHRLPFLDAPDTSLMDASCVAVDPQATENGETGIIVCGMMRDYGNSRQTPHETMLPLERARALAQQEKARRAHGFVFGDETVSGTPDVWAKRAIAAYYEYEVDYIVAEINHGGDMVKHALSSVDPKVPVRVVRASRGKAQRAEPVALLYEQGRVHHVGLFPELEDQMLIFSTLEEPEVSPDRLDAMVWGMNELLVGTSMSEIVKMNDHRLRGRR